MNDMVTKLKDVLQNRPKLVVSCLHRNHFPRNFSKQRPSQLRVAPKQ